MGFKSLGWVVGAAMIAVLAAVGFKEGTNKTGVVDLAFVFNNSEYAKAQEAALRKFGDARSNLLDFLEQNREASAEQSNKLRELMVKDPQTDQDKADIVKLEADIKALDTQYKTLQTKKDPTAAEVAQMNDFSLKSQATYGMLQKWSNDFQDEVSKKKESMRVATMARVNQAIKDVGTKGGYSIIFASDAAPFGANNVTEETKNAMNAQKP